ncbi:MAG: RNA methyltransferase [Alphaproteobacteria bacterium]
MQKSNPPAIVLVRPQMGENIGAAARAMSNFGLTDLRLVAPRDGWPNETAKRVAAGGEHIVEQATIFETTADALAGIQLAFATTARSRDIAKEVLTPAEAVSRLIDASMNDKTSDSSINLLIQSSAILFGPERTGLENEDFALADAFLTIPTTPDHYSLNLGQAVLVLAYEWFRQTGPGLMPNNTTELETINPDHTVADKSEYHALFNQLETYLDEADFFRVAEKKPIMWNNIRNMLGRGQFSSQEIRTLRGILRILREGRKPRKNQED